MVTHDNRILELADRIVNMVDGTIKSDVVLREAVMICEFLRTVDLFKHLTPTELTDIAEKMKRRRYGRDETIIREGESGAMVMKSWTRAMSKQTGGDDGGSIMLMRPDGTEYLALRLRAVVCLDLGLRPFTVSVAAVYRNLLRLHS